MSYENTKCPCGGNKPTDTMLCDECEIALADHPAMKWFLDTTQPVESRRNSAIVLVTAARQRKRNQTPYLRPNTGNVFRDAMINNRGITTNH